MDITSVRIPLRDRQNFQNALSYWARQSPTTRSDTIIMAGPDASGFVTFMNVPEEFTTNFARPLSLRRTR
jgi:hypothetical protein